MRRDPGEKAPVPQASGRGEDEAGRRPYHPPRIVKKRAVSRATLFSGSGPDGGGVVSA